MGPFCKPRVFTRGYDFAIDGAGRCDITMTWQGERAEVPEFGLLFQLRRELTEVSYLGLGPRETTADRTAGGKMGTWSYNIRQDFAQNTGLPAGVRQPHRRVQRNCHRQHSGYRLCRGRHDLLGTALYAP